MPDRSSKRPRDPDQLAYQIMLESTGQAPETEPPAEKAKNPAAVALATFNRKKCHCNRAVTVAAL